MSINVGDKIWIPCEVKPGPFSDERMVFISSGKDEWFGFVCINNLQKGIRSGIDQVLATVTEIKNSMFIARIPGCTPNSNPFCGLIKNVN